MKHAAMALVIVAIFVAQPLAAQEMALDRLSRGTWELGGSIAYQHVEELDQFLLAMRIGPFIASGIQLEFEPNVAWRDIENESLTTYTFLFNMAYNWQTGYNVVPFFLAGGGLTGFSNSDSDTDGVADVGAGIKVFSSGNSAVRIEYRFINQFAETEDIQQHLVQMGFSVFY